MPHIDVRDLSLYHEFHGDGPPLLHISGTGGDLRQTAPSFHGLNADFLGLHYDQRGLGQTSSGDGRQPTMADFADDAAALIEAVGWERCHVAGTSFGGMVAQHLAIRHPDKIDKLILNCTSPGGDSPSYPLHELETLPASERGPISMKIMDTRFTPEDGIPGLPPAFLERYAAGAATESPEAAAGRARQLEARRHHDATTGLAGITAPTLICAGRHDGIAPLSNSEKIAAAIPTATLQVFDGGHIFMLQDPSAIPAMRDFLLA